VKFHWFAELTYPHLGPDFPQKYKSAWVDLPPEVADPVKIGETYRMFIRLMQYADKVNFDGLAVNEHHQNSFAMTPSPNLLAASLAGTTENAAILVIGDSLALYNPPTRVAEEMGYLDCLSGGRLIAGFVVGTPMDTVYAGGTIPVEVRERFHEARKLILRAWAEPKAFAFNGKYTKLRYVNPWPRPVQQPPPVWVPGTGSPETWDLVIDEDYCYGHLSFSGLHNAKPVVDGFWEHVESRGVEVNPNRMAFTQIVCVADSDAEAEALYGDAVRYFYSHNGISPRFLAAPGYQTPTALRYQMSHSRSRANPAEMSFRDFDEAGYIVAGTPETVRQRIRELATTLRIGQLIATPHFGNLSEEAAMKNTHLFGTEVIPYLRDLWADQEDRWTPKVSQERVAANEARLPAGAAR
jgi:alkanesulfonate monooxygenase SsuD/methylene tetrahydromethanopterin reductase-like flavin-dependent oxidoreductase (luciferase family)